METIAVIIIWNVILKKIYTAFYIKTNQGIGRANDICIYRHGYGNTKLEAPVPVR